MIKKLLGSAIVAASLFGLSAPASAALTNWYVDTDGAGGNPAVFVQDSLRIDGFGFIQNTFFGSPFVNGTNFSFKEVARFDIDKALPFGALLSPILTAKFAGTGTGVVGTGISFTPGGTLAVFSGATYGESPITSPIATFTLLSGSANFNSGGVLPNGTVELIFKATSLLAGYFFDSSNNDLSLKVADPEGLVFGLATTQANPVQNLAEVPASWINDFNNAFDPDIVVPGPGDNINQVSTIFVNNPGQFRLEVPEPSMLGLVGLAFLAAGIATRRRKGVSA